MNQIIISVIIPIYNAEQYLSACIESVLKQSFTKFEVLLINDASKDSSSQICDKYAVQDSRIRVFHQKDNGGACVSRNVGLDNANGKYIVCIDADDVVLENHLESLYYSPIIPSGTLVHALYLVENNGIVVNNTEKKESYFIDNLFARQSKIDFLFAGHACSKLLETAIIRNNNLQYRLDINVNEDHIFHLEYLLHINAYKNVGEKTYIYFNREESISKKHFSYEECFERVNLMIPMTEKVLERFRIEEKEVQIALYLTPINAIISSVFALYRSPFRKNKKNRIICLNQILTNYSSHLNDFWFPKNSIDKVIQNILLSKKYHFIDFFMSTIVTVRYTILNKFIKNKC